MGVRWCCGMGRVQSACAASMGLKAMSELAMSWQCPSWQCPS
jgi:hypothetical protein